MVSKQLGSVLAIIGGVFYIIGSLIGGLAIAGFLAGFYGVARPGSISPFGTFSLGGFDAAIAIATLFGLFTGVMIIVGGAMLNSDSPGRRKSGGILAISMMVIGAVPTLGGVGFGFILTLIGGVLGLTYKEGLAPVGYPPAQSTPPGVPIPAGSPMGQKFCTRCGSAIPFGAMFCGNCGAAITN